MAPPPPVALAYNRGVILPEFLQPAQRTHLRRTVFLRALAGVYLIAVVSLWLQLPGLVGSEGILPFERLLDWAWEGQGSWAYWSVPTLLWLWPSNLGLHLICLFCCGCALSVLWGFRVEGPAVLGMWVGYLSLASVGQIFLGFQWDALLLETCFASLFLCRWRPSDRAPQPWAWALLHWLLFRLMFFGGLVKLTSGDPTWADGSALTYHYFTQPLPNPISWYVHHLPVWIHQFSVVLTFALELLLPFCIVLGRPGRRAAAVGFTGLMGLLFVTGNYGYFQLLAVVLCLTLLDDSDLEKCLPIRWRSARVFPRMPHWGAPIAVLWISLTLLRLVSYADLPAPAQSFVKATYPLRSANAYGLFAVMTTTRPEVILEGSREGKNWVAYRLPAKPGPLERMPPQVAPHMPRLDWQLWFAALGNCEQNRWVLMLKKGILDGSPAVLSLFAEDPFEGERPVVVRSVLYDYRFTSPGESGWWRRERLGEYCPRVSQPD